MRAAGAVRGWAWGGRCWKAIPAGRVWEPRRFGSCCDKRGASRASARSRAERQGRGAAPIAPRPPVTKHSAVLSRCHRDESEHFLKTRVKYLSDKSTDIGPAGERRQHPRPRTVLSRRPASLPLPAHFASTALLRGSSSCAQRSSRARPARGAAGANRGGAVRRCEVRRGPPARGRVWGRVWGCVGPPGASWGCGGPRDTAGGVPTPGSAGEPRGRWFGSARLQARREGPAPRCPVPVCCRGAAFCPRYGRVGLSSDSPRPSVGWLRLDGALKIA